MDPVRSTSTPDDGDNTSDTGDDASENDSYPAVIDLTDRTGRMYKDLADALAHVVMMAKPQSERVVLRFSETFTLSEHDVWTLENPCAWIQSDVLNLWVTFLRQHAPNHIMISHCDLFPFCCRVLHSKKRVESLLKSIRTHLSNHDVGDRVPVHFTAHVLSLIPSTNFSYLSTSTTPIGCSCTWTASGKSSVSMTASDLRRSPSAFSK